MLTTNKLLIISLSILLTLTGCKTITSSLVPSNIYAYEYDTFGNLSKTYRITALKSTTTTTEPKTKQIGLELEDSDDNKLVIPEDSIIPFKKLMLESINSTQNESSKKITIKNYVHTIDIKKAKNSRLFIISSLNGVFVFKEKDIQEIVRLLNEIQEEKKST